MTSSTAPVLLPENVARDIVDPDAFAERGRLDRTFAWIRTNNPLGVAAVDGFMPFWVVSKHADIKEIGKRPDIYSSAQLPLFIMENAAIAKLREMTNGEMNIMRSMAEKDGSDHSAHRSLFADWFYPKRLKAIEHRLRDIADDMINLLEEKEGRCDFASEIAAIFPLRVMADILGVEREDEWRLQLMADQLFNEHEADHEAWGNPGDSAALMQTQRAGLEELCTYFEKLTKSRVSDPRDDIATVIAHSHVDGKPLARWDAAGHFGSFATAGHHTSGATLSGAIWTLGEHPELLPQLQNSPSLIPAFIDEVLRYWSPAKHFMRAAIADTELRGRQIRKGDWLYLSYPSANHDEEVFEDAASFRLDRRPNPHMAFGSGPHQCIGQALARMELRLFLEAFLPRVGSLVLEGKPILTRARFVQGAKSLPVSLEFRK